LNMVDMGRATRRSCDIFKLVESAGLGMLAVGRALDSRETVLACPAIVGSMQQWRGRTKRGGVTAKHLAGFFTLKQSSQRDGQGP
jgi:hypothetical protein